MALVKRLRLLPLLLLSLVATGLGTAPAGAHPGDHPHQPGSSPSVALQLAKVRLATAGYHWVGRAEAAGYASTVECVASPAGGMGVHYMNSALAADPAVVATKPELLLYEPTRHGPRLVGVEYLKVDADQDLSTDEDRPSLFGVPFDGPMPGHGPGQPVHYDLHVWLWKHNPSGMFAPFNPRVSC